MFPIKRFLITAFALPLLLAGCLPFGSLQVGVVESPTPTVLVITQEPEGTEPPVVEPAATPTDLPAAPGTAAGDVCFPSEFIPQMTAYFRNVDSETLTELAISENQSSYQVELPSGRYIAFAYTNNDQNLGGAYTNAAATCGLSPDCTDRSPAIFEVLPGETTEGIDLCDWYAQDSLPANPKAAQQADASVAGLVYRSTVTGGIWQVGTDGQARQLASQYEVAISPDGASGLYAQYSDIWHIDFSTGVATNLTRTEGREESGPQWWPANPEWIVFHSFPLGEERGYASGQVTIMHPDGSDYTIIDEALSSFAPALHPLGHTIAYDTTSDGGWLYHMEDGSKERFSPDLYGLDGVQRVSSPAWSPDGNQLAWWVYGDFAATDKVALGVFDFFAGGYQLLHGYTPVSLEGGNPTPIWSPDGQWLASTVIGDQTRGSMWVFRADGIEEINLGNSAYPLWSPDGSQLVFVRWPENGGPAQEATVEIAATGDWTLKETALLVGSFPTDWR